MGESAVNLDVLGTAVGPQALVALGAIFLAQGVKVENSRSSTPASPSCAMIHPLSDRVEHMFEFITEVNGHKAGIRIQARRRASGPRGCCLKGD